MSFTVFISHSIVDCPLVERVKATIEKRGATAYLFEYDVQPGVSIAEKIQREIDHSNAVIVVLTEQGQYSPYVHQEIGYAERCKKPIIPLIEPSVDPRVFGMLAGREYIVLNSAIPEMALLDVERYIHQLVTDKNEQDFLMFCAAALLIVFAAYMITQIES